MTRLTFGVSTSSFAANMADKHNATVHEHSIVHEHSHLWAVTAICDCFYVDDGLLGTDTLYEAAELQQEIEDLFEKGGFMLRKWKLNNSAALRHLPPCLVDSRPSHDLPADTNFKKVLAIEWNTDLD